MIMNTLLLDARVGDRVRFVEEAQAYTIQARSDRYLVCTKPFNLRRTVLYTIVDLKQQVRGTENLVFGAGAETPEQCQEMISRLEGTGLAWTTEVSHRNHIPLRVEITLKGPDRFCGFCHRTTEDGPCGMCKTGPVL
jgi:hypothetical protein